MSVPFPEPTTPVPTRAEVFLGYLDYFRSRLVSELEALPYGADRARGGPGGRISTWLSGPPGTPL